MNTTELTHQEIADWLRLMHTEGVGDITAQLLLRTFGLPEQIFEQTHTQLTKVVSDRVARALLQPEQETLNAHIERTMHWLMQTENHLMTLSCPNYPQHLLSIADPPTLLYAKGRIELLNAPQSIAIVGSRNATTQGIKNTEWFAEELAQGGCQIISGLALGIDTAAHAGALKAYHKAPQQAASTIAVIGTGCDIIYPPRNRELAYAIAEHGLLLSEFPLATKAHQSNFPRRNRIISGLAQGVLVVEAALQSGSLITARQAADQNREVFAIPGSIHSPLSRGCHALIRQGAKLVECAQDILEELHPNPSAQANTSCEEPSDHPDAGSTALPPHAQPNQTRAASKTKRTNIRAATKSEASDPTDAHILNTLGHDPCDIDTLAQRSGIDIGTLLTHLMTLELNGDIEKRAGNVYVRLMG